MPGIAAGPLAPCRRGDRAPSSSAADPSCCSRIPLADLVAVRDEHVPPARGLGDADPAVERPLKRADQDRTELLVEPDTHALPRREAYEHAAFAQVARGGEFDEV